MLKKVPKSIWSLIVVIASILPFGLMKTDYYFMAPGSPYQWDIDIEGTNVYDYVLRLQMYMNMYCEYKCI